MPLGAMIRANPGSEPALWIGAQEVDGQHACGLSVRMPGGENELAVLRVDRREHTQDVMYRLTELGVLYERSTVAAAMRCLRAGDTALDVGAHVGFFTLLFRLLVGAAGRVYAFEPLPETYRRLFANAVHNGFLNIVPVAAAVADVSAQRRFFRHATNDGESSLLFNAGHDAASLAVNVVTLDDLFQRAIPGPFRLLKIDVEGAELRVLGGAGAIFEIQPPSVVIAEISEVVLRSAGVSAWDIRAFLARHGYRAAIINNHEGMDMRGATHWRFIGDAEPSAPDDYGFVYNMLFVHESCADFPEQGV